jgi:D-alanyl-D-alanine carboxypeptidase
MDIYSEAAILIEENTGKILYEKNIYDRKYPASTTKILTAIIALENCDLNETATASEYAVTSVKSGYTKADIQVGETFTIQQLLDVMMLQSANEAANIIAEHISGSVSEFAKLMNQKAKEIGCLDSNFVNANGEHDENHYTTAYDLAMIARYCMKNEEFRKLANKMECSLPRTEYWQDEQVEEHGERNFKNTNNLLLSDSKYYYPYAIGIKSGFTTPAKNCLVSASNKDGFETIAVVLHAEATEDNLSARYVDTINLFEYGYNNYNLDEILEEYDMINEYQTEESTLEITNFADNLINVNDINFSSEIIKIVIGIVLIVFGLYCIFGKGKKGKHENSKDLYKFNFHIK